MHPVLARLAPVLLAALALTACEKVPPKAAPAPAAQPAPSAAPSAAPAAAPAADGLVPGQDYVEIRDGAPFEPQAGRIEVAEAFGYTCPHCAHFEPMLEAWRAKQPDDVRFVAVPAPFGGWWMPFARAYYAAEELGLVAKTHAAVFDALHVTHELPAPPQTATDAQIARVYARFGVDPADFERRMRSFGVQAKVRRAGEWLDRAGVEGTPTLIVAGRYRVLGRSPEDALRIVDTLVARERAARR